MGVFAALDQRIATRFASGRQQPAAAASTAYLTAAATGTCSAACRMRRLATGRSCRNGATTSSI